MSSPFATFRKNQQFWMAALVLVAILAFIIAPAIDMVGNYRRGGSENPVVVSWDGGRMTRSDVETALQKRNQVLNFLRAIAKKVIEYGGEPAVPGFSRSPSGEVTSLGIDETLSPDRVCLNRIFTTQASKMGIQFDDSSADEFLLSFCNEKIADEEFYDILKSHASGLTIHDVREQIKQELAFLVARNLASGINTARPPATTWTDFLKLSQTAKVEAFPVYVHDHVGKVQSLPDESQIQEIFDEGKKRMPSPDSEIPGFVRPARAKAEYIESRFQDWIDKEKPSITEEEIKTEYDRLVGLGQLQVPVTDDAARGTEAPAESGVPTESEGTSETTTPASSTPETSTDGSASGGATTDGTSPTPEESASASNPSNASGDGAASEAPATDSPTPEPSQSEPSPSEPSVPESASGGMSNFNGVSHIADYPQSTLTRSRTTWLVSVLQEEQTATPSEPEQSTTEKSGGEQQRISTNAQDTSIPQESQTSEPEIAVSENSSDSATQANQSDAASTREATSDEQEGIATSEPAAPSQEAASQQAASQPEMRTKTLEEAREQIIEDLAKIKARTKAVEVLTQIQKMMKDYYLAYRQYQAFREAKVDDAEAPVRPDLKKFAEENGLIYGETELADSMQLAATSLGQSSVFMEMRRVGLASEVLPLPQIEPFTPLMSGLAGAAPNEFKEFYFWKVGGSPAVEPQLSDVRDEVIAAWKRKQAWSLAEAAAKELSTKIGSGDDPWASALSETLRPLVITTDPFPWLSRMGMGGQGGIAITSVPKLDGVGEEFMRQVFNTDLGKVGVAPNRAKSVYYVFRVIEKLPSLEELQKRFESDQIKQGPLAVAQEDQAILQDVWLKRVISELNVDFKTDLL